MKMIANSEEPLSPIESILEQFLSDFRCGKQPSIDSYCEANPELGEDLRAALSAALILEAARSDGTNQTTTGLGPSANPLPRSRLGEYRLIREAGRGGMGIVYEAIQESLGRRVAVKTLVNKTTFNPSQLERFHRETRAVAALHHTNIVPVFAVGEDQGELFYVMPFINGTGLEKVISQLRRLARNSTGDQAIAGDLVDRVTAQLSTLHDTETAISEVPKGVPIQQPLSDTNLSHESRGYWHRVARIGLQVADALHYACQQGVLHRDIKPSNLLLDVDGIVWVTDFGLAKLDESADLTKTGELLGTLRYLAPERLKGVHDIRGDIYGLGLTLYELLTLQSPFESVDKADLARSILESDPPQPRRIDLRIPLDLETIVLKAIAKSPSDRYQTPLQLADDLRLFLEDRPIRARRAGALERTWRLCRRNPVVSSLTGCLALLMLTTIALLVVSNSRIRRESGEKALALQTMKVAQEERELAYRELAVGEKLAQRRFYATQVNLAGHAIQKGEFTRAEDLVESVVPASGKPDLRGFEWNYLRGVLHQGLEHVFQHPQNAVNCTSFSPNRSLLLIAGGNANSGFACVYNTKTGKQVYDLECKCVVNGCAFSPDGSKFVLGYGDGNLQVVSTDTGQTAFWHSNVILIKSLAWSPDGTQIVIGGEYGELCLYNLPAYDLVTFPHLHQAPVVRTFYSRDGLRLYSSSDWGGEGQISRVWDMTISPPVLKREFQGHSLVEVSPDGKTVIGVDAGRIDLLDADSGEVVKKQEMGVGEIVSAKYSADGKRLYSASRTDRVVRQFDASTLDLVRTYPQNSAVTTLALEPAGELWAAGDISGDVRVWETRGLATEFKWHDQFLSQAFFLDDNSLILGSNRESQKWEIDGGDPRQYHSATKLRAISGDGKTLVGVVASKDKGEIVEVWREGATTPIRIELNDSVYMNCIAISKSGRMLAVRSDTKPISIYDLQVSPPTIRQSLQGPCHQVVFSPDERFLLGGEQYGGVCCFDLETGTRLSDLAGFESWWAWGLGVAFSHDGKYAAVGNESGTVRVWEMSSQKLLSTMKGQPGEINAIAFFPDDRRLASGGADGVRIWDYQVGQELLSLESSHKVMSLAINPIGDTLVAIDYYGTVFAWIGRDTQ